MIPIAKPQIGDEEKAAVAKVLESGMIASGPRVEEFEGEFAKFVGTKYAIATTSGTTALHLKLLSINVGSGDEVIVPAFSFIASANAILFCRAKPVFCDVDPRTFNIDPNAVEPLISKKTKAIMPVHLYGQAANMKPLLEIGERYNIAVVGDAAQAHGAKYNGKMVGSFGKAECFSFYPTKNMTTGEGGIITTNDDKIAECAFSLRNHGREKTQWGYEHGRLGYNYRMTDVEAAIGIEQLKKLPNFNKKRQENAKFMSEQLQHINDIEVPFVLNGCEHVYHQYTIKCINRSSNIERLKKHGIGFGIYYPKPLHFYPHLKQYGHKKLKISENLANEVLSIPIHPSLSKDDITIITKCFK